MARRGPAGGQFIHALRIPPGSWRREGGSLQFFRLPHGKSLESEPETADNALLPVLKHRREDGVRGFPPKR
jgi:hypothetical protein